MSRPCYLVSRRTCAALLGVDPKTIGRYIDEGCPVHCPGTGAGSPMVLDTRQVTRWLRARSKAIPVTQIQTARISRAAEHARGLRLENDRMEANLLDVADTRATITLVVESLRDNVDRLAAREDLAQLLDPVPLISQLGQFVDLLEIGLVDQLETGLKDSC